MKWFQVDSDTPGDFRIKAVIRDMGNRGMGALFRLWCHIADHGSQPGRSIDAKGKPIPVEELIDATAASDFDAQDFHKLVGICVASGHFNRQAWERKKEILIPAMVDRADTYTRRKVRRKVEHGSKSVRTVFPNNTVQDSTTQDLKAAPSGAPEKAAADAATHTPPVEQNLDFEIDTLVKAHHYVDPNAHRPTVALVELLVLEQAARLPKGLEDQDLCESVKDRCAKLRLTYDGELVQKAIASETAKQQKGVPRKRASSWTSVGDLARRHA